VLHIVSLLTAYYQETGRAGRDEMPADAIMYVNKNDIGKSTTSQEMKSYCTLQSCRRKFLSEHFGTHFVSSSHHTCCDNCERNCICSNCATSSEVSQDESIENVDQPCHDTETEQLLNISLPQDFSAVNSVVQQHSILDATLQTGLTQLLAKDIAASYEQLLELEVLQSTYNYVADEYIRVIHEIIRSTACSPVSNDVDVLQNEM
jgi:hypothetical protein